MKAAAADDDYRVANMTTDKGVDFQFHLSNAKPDTTSWSIADTDRTVNQLDSEIYGIILNEQTQFKMTLSICVAIFDACWQALRVQELQKTIEQHVSYIRNVKMSLMSHILERIWWMGSGNDFTTDISEQHIIRNVKESYQSTHKVNYIGHMLMHNDWCTEPDYMEETLLYCALYGRYNIGFAIVCNLLSAANKLQHTHRAHLQYLQNWHEEPFFRPITQQVHHLRGTNICRVRRSIKFTSLRVASRDFGIPNFGQWFRPQIDQD